MAVSCLARLFDSTGDAERKPNIGDHRSRSLAWPKVRGDHPDPAMSTSAANVDLTHGTFPTAHAVATRSSTPRRAAAEQLRVSDSDASLLWRLPVEQRHGLDVNERAAVLGARTRAVELLQNLLADRTMLEARLASGGRTDPMKTVRGASSIECAIKTTREMIGAYDVMLGSSETH